MVGFAESFHYGENHNACRSQRELKKGDLDIVYRISTGQGRADHIGRDPKRDRQHHHALDDDKDGFHLKIAVRVLFRHGLVKQRRQKEQQCDEYQL